jgi:hypothetical protein
MEKTISNAIIRKFHPCYDPSKFITDENEELPIKEWIGKYRKVVPAKDILWLLLRREFLSEKDLRLFAVWCAREALKLIKEPNKRIVDACNVVERYANGKATKEELLAAANATRAAYYADAANYVAYYTDLSTATAARDGVSAVLVAVNTDIAVSNDARVVYFAALAASDAATRDAQLEQLLTYFE